jgi:single-stranded-DNA-specific exonuclease
VINPKRSDSRYPFTGLSGSGVVWKVLQAIEITRHMRTHIQRSSQSTDLRTYLDIICLGTIADCMPMIDENRTIVRQGLEQARTSRHAFFQTLMRDQGRHIRDESDIAFFV